MLSQYPIDAENATKDQLIHWLTQTKVRSKTSYYRTRSRRQLITLVKKELEQG